MIGKGSVHETRHRRSPPGIEAGTDHVQSPARVGPPLRAQAPPATSQVLNFNGNIPGQPDGPVAVRLRLYDTNAGGTLQFEETQTVTVAAERFLVQIGQATAGGVPATVFRGNTSL